MKERRYKGGGERVKRWEEKWRREGKEVEDRWRRESTKVEERG